MKLICNRGNRFGIALTMSFTPWLQNRILGEGGSMIVAATLI